MAHLELDIPEDVYESLEKTAKQSGQPLEELAVQCLVVATRYIAEDPFIRHIGSIDTDVKDWADNHDHYIGQSLMESMRYKSDDGKDG